MKKLILNGSPHKNGDTSYIVNELKKKLDGLQDFYLKQDFWKNLDICI